MKYLHNLANSMICLQKWQEINIYNNHDGYKLTLWLTDCSVKNNCYVVQKRKLNECMNLEFNLTISLQSSKLTCAHHFLI